MGANQTYPKGERDDDSLLARFNEVFGHSFESIEFQTDKAQVKVVPCVGCSRPIGVNTFYAPAIAKCAGCGQASASAGKGEAEIVQAGRTDPAKAKRLEDCLINQHFALARCPAHPDDDEHEMELKWVAHNDHYGPQEHMGGGKYRQIAPGETVMHQCKKCRATVSYSTTAQVQFSRMNEPRPGKHVNGWAHTLGTRPEAA